jgi:hypothetical protein
MARQQKKLGEILVDWGIVKAAEVARALEHAKSKNLRIGEALVDLKLCSEANVYKALAQQHNMEYIDLDKNGVPPETINQIPDDLMRKYLILPLGKDGNKLRVAIHDPLDLEMLDILRSRAQGAHQGHSRRPFQHHRRQHHRQDDGPDDRPAARFARQIAR